MQAAILSAAATLVERARRIDEVRGRILSSAKLLRRRPARVGAMVVLWAGLCERPVKLPTPRVAISLFAVEDATAAI